MGKKHFLLLDGHHSRKDLPFLDYIHNDNHEWACCIGVIYATHIWQVADLPQLKGSFKTELTRAKRCFFDIKSQRGHQNFEMTDIVPLGAQARKKVLVLCKMPRHQLRIVDGDRSILFYLIALMFKKLFTTI
jgi:hypothetical protein